MDLRITPTPLRSGVFILCLSIAPLAQATDTFVEPTELITASPEDELTQRTGVQHAQDYSGESLIFTQNNRLDDLNAIPSVQVRQSGSPTVSIRGSAANGRTLGLVDGFLLNTGDGLGMNRLLIPSEILSQVSLLKTPASAAYGGDAMGGALRFRSRVLTRAAARGSLGSFGERGLFLGSPLQNDPTADRFTQITYFRQDIDGEQPFKSAHSDQSGVYHRNDRHLERATVMSHGRLGAWELQPQLIWAREIGSSPNSILAGAMDGPIAYRNEAYLAGFGVGRALTEKTEAGYRIQQVESKVDSLYEPFPSLYTNKSQRLQQSLRYSHEAFADLRLEGFLDHIMDTYTESSPSLPTPAPLQTENATDVGVRAGFGFGNNWWIQPMGRYLTREQLLMGSLSLTQDLPAYRMWASYNDGFRRPGLSDRFSRTSFFVGNPALRPERSSLVELGFMTKTTDPDYFWRAVRYGFTIFQGRYLDLFQGADVSPGVTTKVNIDEAETQGVEFQSEYAWSVWSVRLEVASLNAENRRTHRRLTLAPEHQVTAHVTHQLGPVVFELRSTQWGPYTDEYVDPISFARTTHEFSGWNKTDFGIRTLGFANWSVRAGVENIFDTPRELTYGYPEALRRYFISAERQL